VFGQKEIGFSVSFYVFFSLVKKETLTTEDLRKAPRTDSSDQTSLIVAKRLLVTKKNSTYFFRALKVMDREMRRAR
jgi:hypothetical protein